MTVLVLTAYSITSGDDDNERTPPSAATPGVTAPTPPASPAPSYSRPREWTEPQRWTALPPGSRTDDHKNPVGFPRTTEGAVASMLPPNSSRIEGTRSARVEQREHFESYMEKAYRTPENLRKTEEQAAALDRDLAKEMGVAQGSPLPPGAYVHATVVGYKIIKQSDTEVSAWLLSRVVQKNGELEQEVASYRLTISGARWESDDWKIGLMTTAEATQAVEGRAEPPIVAVGDKAFNDGGWTAIRSAS
ncbi:hypothetical protein ACN20G_36665 (plasmid) [Streptomyces sp. BI20]|uniref:hypothetical protein n=1 Tax=Streptomyces sp. BI20 TaxID=3403460 RepID=UPI003C78535C